LKKIDPKRKALKNKLRSLKKKLSKFAPDIPMKERNNKMCRRYYADRDKIVKQIEVIRKAIAIILDPKGFSQPKPKNPQEKEKKLYRETFYGWLGNLPFRDNRAFKDYRDYCRSDYFKRLKAEVLRRDGYKCRKCGQKALTAHHEKYRWQWTRSRTEDCIAICDPCHKNIHFPPKKEPASQKLKLIPINRVYLYGGKYVVEYGGKFKGAFTKESDAIKRLSALRHQITP
jgi:ribosomal protein S27AE